MDEAGDVFFEKLRKIFWKNRKAIERLYIQRANDFCDYVTKEKNDRS
jgi:hypothetical protein